LIDIIGGTAALEGSKNTPASSDDWLTMEWENSAAPVA
jgi:hypothetical protein